jgi:hypothetical protein
MTWTGHLQLPDPVYLYLWMYDGWPGAVPALLALSGSSKFWIREATMHVVSSLLKSALCISLMRHKHFASAQQLGPRSADKSVIIGTT